MGVNQAESGFYVFTKEFRQTKLQQTSCSKMHAGAIRIFENSTCNNYKCQNL